MNIDLAFDSSSAHGGSMKSLVFSLALLLTANVSFAGMDCSGTFDPRSKVSEEVAQWLDLELLFPKTLFIVFDRKVSVEDMEAAFEKAGVASQDPSAQLVTSLGLTKMLIVNANQATVLLLLKMSEVETVEIDKSVEASN